LAPNFSDNKTLKKKRIWDIGLVTVEDIYEIILRSNVWHLDTPVKRKYLTEAYTDHTVWVLLAAKIRLFRSDMSGLPGTNNWS
jgi:hypothetical protein